MPKPELDNVLTGFDTSLDEPEVTAYVDDAGVLLRQAYDDGELDAEVDTTLWKYLARHLIRHEPDQQTKGEALGSARKDYTGAFGQGLRATSPGQTALRLDPHGQLAELDPTNDELFFKSL